MYAGASKGMVRQAHNRDQQKNSPRLTKEFAEMVSFMYAGASKGMIRQAPTTTLF